MNRRDSAIFELRTVNPGLNFIGTIQLFFIVNSVKVSMERGSKAVSSVEMNFPKNEIGERYEVSKIIGKGSYGFVAEAKIKGSNVKVAIKKVTHLFDDEIDAKRILREICILKKLNHPNLVHIIEIIPPLDYKTFNAIYLVTEYCQSDLRKVFKSQHIFLELSHIKSITYQILCGLNYLHSRDILHRDLKPANVLINQDSSIKICDFGLARSMEGISEGDKEREIIELPEEGEQDKMQELLRIEQSPEKKEEQKGKGKLERSNKVKLPKSEEKPILQKELTMHVTTRWYRAPEVILLEKNYNEAIDMWSVGCIFGELLKMIKETCPSVVDRFPLFPGKYCYPLSPGKLETIQKNGFPHTKQDQLDMIFSTVGTPNETEMSFVTDPKARAYLKSFAPQNKANLAAKFLNIPKEAIDFLERTIVFDPRKRITVSQALQHPLFESIRDPSKQQPGLAIKLGFENEGDLNEARLRELFIQEIRQFERPK